MKLIKLIYLILILITGLAHGQEAGVEIIYVANEGVYITGGGESALVDALHSKYKDDYLYPSQTLVDTILNGNSPYESVDLVLVSHVHGDHFDASMVAEFLEIHQESILISSQQVSDSLRLYVADSIKARIFTADHRQNRRTDFIETGASVSTLGIRHANNNFKWIQNLGYLVTINGVKILHVGDPDPIARRFSRFSLPEENVDIAVIPYWFIYERELLDEYIDAELYILTHISPGEDISGYISDNGYEDVRVFTESGQIISY